MINISVLPLICRLFPLHVIPSQCMTICNYACSYVYIILQDLKNIYLTAIVITIAMYMLATCVYSYVYII